MQIFRKIQVSGWLSGGKQPKDGSKLYLALTVLANHPSKYRHSMDGPLQHA
ncbi:hypothetical protein [Acetobacter orientalis]|uniref:hypothetical protein n=1 Tax=Acetobacter orientalis TaxID=146474 RepID=UPI0015C51467|nr:hypothetical protein [Acetobacter orientalis]MDN6041743.1 hypothetical protein [Acetobacter sp.]